MSEEKLAAIQKALEEAFRHRRESAGPAAEDPQTRDFVFHMTDWIHDLQRLSALYNEPEKHSADEWSDAISGMTIHAIGHLLAASKLDQDVVCNPFNVYVRRSREMPSPGKDEPLTTTRRTHS